MPAKGTSPRERWNPLLKSYPDSEKVNAVSIGAETMFTRLIAKADDYGNYWASPRRLLAGLFSYRWDHGEVDETLMVRWRNELVTCMYGPLIVCYSVNDIDYLHLINPRRRFRADTDPQELVPREPANIDEKALSEHVTKTYQERTGNVPLDLDLDLDLDLENQKHTDSSEELFETKPEKTYRSAKGKTLKGEVLEKFESFLTAFGDKRGKADAADAWLKLKPLPDELYTAIIAGAERYAVYRAGLKNGSTPKMAQGWLNSKRWEDIPATDSTIHIRPAAEYEKAFD